MRSDAFDLGERHVLRGEQAVLHLQNLLAHDVEARLHQQVVHARDRPSRGVLDRQHGTVGSARFQRVDGATERGRPLVSHLGDRREVVPRGRVAVAPRDALIRNPQCPILLTLLPDGLKANRVPKDLAVQRGGEVAVHARVLGELVDPREECLLAVRVLDRERAIVGP